MPREETEKLLEDIQQIKEKAADLRWSDNSTFVSALETLEGSRRPSASGRFEDQVWRALREHPEWTVAREPSNSSTQLVPNFLVTAGPKTFLVEAATGSGALRAAERLSRELDAFGATAGFVVVPGPSPAEQNGAVRLVSVDELNSALTNAVTPSE
jgi:hypothetical protein